MIRSRHTNAIRVNYDPDRRSFLPPSADDTGPFAWWAFYRKAVDAGAHVELLPDAPLGDGYSLYQVVTPIGGGWDDQYYLVHHDPEEEGTNEVDVALRRIREKRQAQGPEERPCECEHIDHFEGGAHDYGHTCADVVELRTVSGTFYVCPDCRDGHLADFLLQGVG